MKCCCMTGSTDAATDVVESATFRKTFNAIQSSKNSFRIWYAPKVGSLRIVYGIVSQRKRFDDRNVSYKVPHDLARHISPSDQDAP